MNKEGVCPINGSQFECQKCKAIGQDGKCSYMRLDDWAEETLRVMAEVGRKFNSENNVKLIIQFSKLDDWAEETLRVMKKLAEDRIEKSNRTMVR